jgi:predicted transcriptional regulator
MLVASYGTGAPIWSQNIPVQVILEKKIKKKSLKNKTKIISKKIEKKVIPNGIPEIENQKQEYSIA